MSKLKSPSCAFFSLSPDLVSNSSNMMLKSIYFPQVGLNLDSADLLSSDTLLAHLMSDDDDGRASPNPTTFYLMRRKAGMDTLPKAAKVGSAYRWAQVLAGLQFPDEMPPEDSDAVCQPFKADKAVCQTKIEAVVKAIRQRYDKFVQKL